MRKSSSYWDKRAIKRLNDAEKQSEKYINRVKKIYNRAYKNIEKELQSIYKNYSKDTGLDVQKLKELLTRSETKKTWEQMKKQGLDKYIKNNYKSRISRLEQLQAQIYAKAKLIYSKEELENTMCYKGVIHDSYYKAVYDTQMGTGYNFNFSTLDENLVKSVLNDNWSGKNYSERIWGNTDILADKLSEIVGGALISGQGIELTSRQLRDKLNVAKHYAERLIRTETNHFNNEADALAYAEMGVRKYVFVATLDSRTSEICQSHDNKVFNFKDREIGVNFPPLHPNCRSTTRGYLGEEAEKNLKRRARNPITGKMEIIDNMSYKEWYNKNVREYGKDKIDIAHKKVKYKKQDRKQYENYKNRLLNSPYLPKRFEEFVKLKYNNINNYKQLNREYRTIGKINKKSSEPIRDINMYYQFRQDEIEMTDHAIEHYFDRMYDKKGNKNYNYNKIVEIINKKANYIDTTNNRNICYYDKIAIIKEINTNEVVSIRKGRLSKKWKEI